MKYKLIRYVPFRLYESTSFEEYLAEMSLKGWLIEKISANDLLGFMTFRKVEARKRIFCVDIFGLASDSDNRPRGQTADYVELCKAAGWEFLCKRGKMLVFFSEDENAVPIQTDEELKLHTISKETWKRIGTVFLYAFMFSFLALSRFSRSTFEYSVVRYSGLFLTMAIAFIAIINLILLLDFSIWKIGMQADRKAGRPIRYRVDYIKARTAIRSVFIAGALISLSITIVSMYFETNLSFSTGIKAFILGLVLIGFTAVYYFIRKISKSAGQIYFIACGILLSLGIFAMFIFGSSSGGTYSYFGSRGIVTVSAASHNTLPLTLEDLGITGEGTHESTAEVNQTFLASAKEYSEQYYVEGTACNYMSYTIFSSPFDWVFEKFIAEQQKAHFVSPDNQLSSAWGAKSVNIDSRGDTPSYYLIVYGDKILELQVGFALSSEQIAVIREKLNL